MPTALYGLQLILTIMALISIQGIRGSDKLMRKPKQAPQVKNPKCTLQPRQHSAVTPC